MENELSLEYVIETYKQAIRNGASPSIDKFAQEYPQHRDTILDIFPTIQTLEALKVEQQKKPTKIPVNLNLEFLGEYKIIREIGRGGMGIVYEAIQISLDRTVAIKVLPWLNHADETTLKRFKQEAKIAAQLEYPHIIPIIGVDNYAGIHYYVMRYIDGFSLDQIISYLRQYLYQNDLDDLLIGKDNFFDLPSISSLHSNPTPQFLLKLIGKVQKQRIESFENCYEVNIKNPLEPFLYSKLPNRYYQEVAILISQVAEALDYAHNQQAVHRDIKPANLFLDSMAMIWIGDFGLAKNLGSESLTRTHDLLGTMRYMAPELFQGDENDAQSDIYSLGLTLYELLTLEPAFGTQTPQLMNRIMHGKRKLLRQINPNIPIALETIVLKAIQVGRNARYSSCQAMQADLDSFVMRQPHSATDSNVRYKQNKRLNKPKRAGKEHSSLRSKYYYY